MMKIVLVFALILLVGCATQASLTVGSEPEGAYISDVVSGQAWGIAPITLAFDPNALIATKDASGCYLVRGVNARWVSGAVTKVNPIKLWVVSHFESLS